MKNFLTFLSDIYIDFILIGILLVVTLKEANRDILHVLGLVVTIPSLVLWALARIQLGTSFSFWPEAKGLITRGLYSKIRHPIYVFSTLAFLGIALMLNNIYFYAFWIGLLLVEIYRARREEQLLIEKFGQAYLDYRKQTWF
ncbi:MAG: isoprenylcysteine carboxylmethyltransferase family protein [Candidatus Doudnabacteria bacterium]|nr:isoprenylcysteine carboxylmethyltransferase family protein [Candidatus Doudnabacteria bacterium]